MCMPVSIARLVEIHLLKCQFVSHGLTRKQVGVAENVTYNVH